MSVIGPNDILIRLAKNHDVKNIFNWRNDSLTRQMSHSKENIDWISHNKWFNKSLKSKNKLILIACSQNFEKNLAVVRFDMNEKFALVSINLNPCFRGKNLSKKILHKSISFFSQKLCNIKILHAEISDLNLKSKKIFESEGFILYKKIGNLGFYKKNLL